MRNLVDHTATSRRPNDRQRQCKPGFDLRVSPAEGLEAPDGHVRLGGIRRNEIEDARPAHINAGCNVLLHAMLERAVIAVA